MLPAAMADPSLPAIRQRYEATPRELDDDLMRMARGDRGCLGDLVTGIGAVGIVVFGVLGSLGRVGWGPMLVSGVVMVVGFFLGTAAQAQSQVLRRRALTHGPLVLGRVVAVDPAAYEPGDATHPARVVFSPTPAHRFDAPLLRRLTERLQALQAATTTPPDQAAVAAVLREPNNADTVRLPPSLAGEVEAYLAVVVLDARRLPDRRLGGGEVSLIVDPTSGFAEHV
jgi:hypothetical protein